MAGGAVSDGVSHRPLGPYPDPRGRFCLKFLSVPITRRARRLRVMSTWKSVVLFAPLAVATAIAACGGGSSETPPPADPSAAAGSASAAPMAETPAPAATPEPAPAPPPAAEPRLPRRPRRPRRPSLLPRRRRPTRSRPRRARRRSKQQRARRFGGALRSRRSPEHRAVRRSVFGGVVLWSEARTTHLSPNIPRADLLAAGAMFSRTIRRSPRRAEARRRVPRSPSGANAGRLT